MNLYSKSKKQLVSKDITGQYELYTEKLSSMYWRNRMAYNSGFYVYRKVDGQ